MYAGPGYRRESGIPWMRVSPEPGYPEGRGRAFPRPRYPRDPRIHRTGVSTRPGYPRDPGLSPISTRSPKQRTLALPAPLRNKKSATSDATFGGWSAIKSSPAAVTQNHPRANPETIRSQPDTGRGPGRARINDPKTANRKPGPNLEVHRFSTNNASCRGALGYGVEGLGWWP